MIAYVPECAQTMQIESRGNTMFKSMVIDKLEDYRFIPIHDNTEWGLHFQKRGIDYFMLHPDCNTGLLGLELKCEQRNSYGNLFIEHLQNIRPPREGWLHSCSAHFLCYGFLKPEPTIYVLDMRELRVFLTETPMFLVYGCKIQRKRDLPSKSAGFCVPISDLRSCLKHFHEIKIETPPDALRAAFSMAIHE